MYLHFDFCSLMLRGETRTPGSYHCRTRENQDIVIMEPESLGGIHLSEVKSLNCSNTSHFDLDKPFLLLDSLSCRSNNNNRKGFRMSQNLCGYL